MVLPIKKKWFDLIVSGEKKEEYREIKPYYTKRFQKLFAPYYVDQENFWDRLWMEECRCGWFADEVKEITFRNGYSSKSPTVIVKAGLRVGTGNLDWGAEEGVEYYVLEIKDMIPQEEIRT